ncbi:MAG: hypothetical protein KTR31_15270 [Myxococcales bacterium]|nr:hypothetical protein [Myxococcales bacterium]
MTGWAWISVGLLGCTDHTESTSTTLDPLVLDPASTTAAGGAVTMLADGRTAAVSDTRSSRVLLVDTEQPDVIMSTQLQRHAQPGQLVEDHEGRLWVTLRRGGRVLVLEGGTLRVVRELAPCPQPRGLDVDRDGSVWLACASGELVHMDVTGVLSSTLLDVDLHDVVVDQLEDRVWVSRRTSAEVLSYQPSAPQDVARFELEALDTATATFLPNVAWRMIAHEEGGILLLHQRASTADLIITLPSGYYSGDCFGIVHAAISRVTPDGDVETSGALDHLPVPTDLVRHPDGDLVIAVAGTNPGGLVNPASVVRLAPGSLRSDPEGCVQTGRTDGFTSTYDIVSSVAVAASGRIVSVSADPFVVRVAGEPVIEELDGSYGYEVFHRATVFGDGNVACASCHPDGHEDGHTWSFEDIGERRTQDLAGGLSQSAPFHWQGELADLGELMNQVYTDRMGGLEQDALQISALQEWLDDLPTRSVTPQGSQSQIDWGRALFHSDEAGCIECHNGPTYSDGTRRNVGTGGRFSVPHLLGVANRLPLMHDGCADDLMARFRRSCGGADHGASDQELSRQERLALIAFLETL